MSLADRTRLAGRTSTQYANGGHRALFTGDLNAAAGVHVDCADYAEQAESAADIAAASLALAQALVGLTQGIGLGGLDVPRNVELGTAAYADAALLRGIFVATQNAAYQILPQDWGRLLLTTSGTNTWTLPLAADVPDGWHVYLKNRSGNNLTIARTSSDTINGTTSLTVSTGSGLTLVKSGAAAFETF
jgi:hypothetical protein